MVRRLALIALVAGVALGGPAAAEARTATGIDAAKSSTSKTKAKRSKSKAKKSKRLAKSKAKQPKRLAKSKAKSKSKSQSSRSAKSKRKSKPKKVPRIPDRTTDYAANMPRGFEWPPTDAMRQASERCEAQLDELGVVWERAKPEGRIVDPIVVPAMELGGVTYRSAYRRGPHKLECQFARTLATLGAQLLVVGVREVKFGSIYRNTTVRVGGKSKNILSRHALGIAMDVVSVVDVSGREIVVKTDYPNADPVLLGMEEVINASGMFRTVLTPRNDPESHHDHFHIEAVVDYAAPDAP